MAEQQITPNLDLTGTNSSLYTLIPPSGYDPATFSSILRTVPTNQLQALLGSLAEDYTSCAVQRETGGTIITDIIRHGAYVHVRWRGRGAYAAMCDDFSFMIQPHGSKPVNQHSKKQLEK